MPKPTRKPRAHRRAAPIFAALGDETRLTLLDRLAAEPQSIVQLAKGAPITRQAISKHLGVLGRAGLVRSARRGRETRFSLVPGALEDAHRRLDEVSRLWDDALERLKRFVEAGPE